MVFRDRQDAGKKLGLEIKSKYHRIDCVVYGIPRGGVVVALEVAKVLNAPLDVILSQKIGHPLQPEYAVAVVTEHGYISEDKKEVESLDSSWFEEQIQQKKKEIHMRKQLYLSHRDRPPVQNKIALLVDDGIATGRTMEACILEVKEKNPKKIIIASPVAPDDVVSKLRKKVDDVIVLENAEKFLGGISAYYENFDQVSDEDVINLLQ